MRTTVADVRAVIPTGLDNNEINLLAGIANRMVTNNLGTSTALDDATKKDIETYLTAHLIAIGKERQTKIERVDDIWVEYKELIGEGIRSTTYGQAVTMLDPTGIMERSTMRKAFIRAIEQNPDRLTS